MHEIELKLQVPAERLADVEAAVCGRQPPPALRLRAAYFDTADRRLAGAALALRLRREGRRWVQTLKGAGDDGLTRQEHNVVRGSASAMPVMDPTLHAGTPAGERLLALLDAAPAAPLHTLYRTDITRHVRELRVRAAGAPQARVELAFDRGRIEADPHVLAVGELEIELLAGSPHAVIETARRWQARHGLWIDLRSKAERGDLLARGERIAPARHAAPSRVAKSMDAAAAWHAVLRACAEQVLANASQIASGEHAAEHVHQLRIGLRRLRSAGALFEHPDGGLMAGAAQLFRQLGAARDADVVEREFGPSLDAAMRSTGLDPAALAAPSEAPTGNADAVLSVALVRADATQQWLLDLLAAMQPDAAVAGSAVNAGQSSRIDPAGTAEAPPLRALLAARLNRWHRRIVADAARYAELDDAGRHRLRKRAKRQRYATEFCAPLFGQRAVRRYLKALRALQERLGAVSDAAMAAASFATRATADPQAMFALGWLAARREALAAAATPELTAFAKVERFWKKAPKRRD
jgi:inorganic triphosphatase YgiF